MDVFDPDGPDDPIVTSTLRHRDDPDISDVDVLLMLGTSASVKDASW